MSKHAWMLYAALILVPVECLALDGSAFSDVSKLAEGRWVKIAVEENGVYQLTADELVEMGFPNPGEVKIFGYGGHMMPESITAYSKDDLQQVPVMRTSDGKLCFYANGVHQVSAVDYMTPRYFNVTINAYSTHGYYFLTDDSRYDALSPEVARYREMQDGDEAIEHSYAFCYHESELTSVGFSGKNLLGEDMLPAMEYTGNAFVPNVVQGSTLHVSAVVAGLLPSEGIIGVRLNGVDAKISSGTRLSASTDGSVYYSTVNSKGSVAPLTYPEEMPITISVDCDGDASLLHLDKYVVSYVQNNRLPADSSQVRLDIEDAVEGKNVKMQGVDADVVVWNIDDAQRPVQCALKGDEATGEYRFSLPANSSWSSFVVFDPLCELKSISGFEYVGNQNLHGMETPNYVIITTKELTEQAERVAELHRRKEGMDVAVIDQQLIFNEFSSGATDPSGVRMFLKMLYDRNPGKLKYLLLFGDGSYDNRRILDKNPYEKLVTYQSTVSNSDVASYVTDDYFGFLSDDASTNLQDLTLSIAVGRLPVGTVDEAAAVVDKLEEYAGNPDYGEWRNNAFVIADDGDDGLHEYQAVGIASLLDGGVEPGLNVWRIYDGSYPNAEGRSEDSNAVMEELLKQGQLFFTYIGHGAALNGLCLWDRADVERVKYDKWPFATFATCDVARFDGDARGVAEQMVLERDGGVIACMVATRTVYSDSNDKLNRSLVRYLFSLDEERKRRSIGEAYMLAKNSISNEYEANKIKFVLLGDPALVLEYPLPLARIDRIGDVAVSASAQAVVYPQTSVQVSGVITDAHGNIDSEFDGEATVSLYDAEVMYDDLAEQNAEQDEHRIAMLHRELLARSTARVVSGRYEATLAVPKNCLAQGGNGMVRIYAASADGTKIVDGQSGNVVIHAYDESKAEADNSAPEITQMYIDSEDFVDGGFTGSDIVLYASVEDDKGINMQSLSIDGTFMLSLDGGFNTFPDVDGGFTVGDGGKSGVLAYPVGGLTEGPHTLALRVTDMAGNVGERTVAFSVVTEPVPVLLSVEKRTAIDEVAFDLEYPAYAKPVQDVYLTVTRSDGTAVMHRRVQSFPFVWDLVGDDGNRLAPGLYRFYGVAADGSPSIVSPQGEIVVLDL